MHVYARATCGSLASAYCEIPFKKSNAWQEKEKVCLSPSDQRISLIYLAKQHFARLL